MECEKSGVSNLISVGLLSTVAVKVMGLHW